MRNLVPIENIEEMRLREGIDDTELRKEIRRLKVGDFVRLTMLTRAPSMPNSGNQRGTTPRSRFSNGKK